MIADVLSELEQLLQAHGQPHFANLARRAHDAYLTNPEEFQKQMASVDWWGGSGALWEVNLRDQSDDRNLDQHFMTLIVRLVDALEEEGLATPRSRQVADVFREWLSKRY